jgi:hypothetical protein
MLISSLLAATGSASGASAHHQAASVSGAFVRLLTEESGFADCRKPAAGNEGNPDSKQSRSESCFPAALDIDPANETALLWLGYLVDGRDDRYATGCRDSGGSCSSAHASRLLRSITELFV